MITCQQADILAAALSVGSIDPTDQGALLQHLPGCASCRRVAGEYMAAAARLPLALEPVRPSPELRGRLMRAVYAEAEQAQEHAARDRPSTWWARAWQALPASRGFTVAAAAAAVAIIGLASWRVSSGRPPAPTSVAVALAATQAAPHAHGVLTYTRGGNEAVLTATGLPGPGSVVPGRTVYEVWLIRPNGTAVAATYLSHNPDGTWSAVVHGNMSAYSVVAATPEPAGGSAAPTGAKVIQGELSSS
ncbi:MAG: anti-sigma factor [Candidatus Dormibacteraeota bacterium]|nr:anti-sigma factor [Candidatus Dormibacteraeota bacterium]